MADPKFDARNQEMIERMGQDADLKESTRQWFQKASQYEYSYHFKWMGRPIIQFPQDMVVMQELVWEVKPDLIIEMGIARGGSLIYYASLLALLGGERRVLGVDVDIREHNRDEIENHPMFDRISMLEGSSIDAEIIKNVHVFAKEYQTIMLVLDSNHTHSHVLQELEGYSDLVTFGSYLIVFDTIVEYMPEEFSAGRPWKPGDNPATALQEFMRSTDRFEIVEAIDHKALITVAPGGFLKCVKDRP